MLNEIQEMNDYTFDQEKTDIKPHRIKRSIFLHANDLNGIERMLTVIARAFIFDENAADYVQGRRRAEAAMRMWLGLTDGITDKDKVYKEYKYLSEKEPWLDRWLARYLREDASNDTDEKKEKIEKALKKLEGKKTQYEKKSLEHNYSGNDYKLLTYDKVLSNAQVAYGSLKRYYLVCTKENWHEGLFKITNTNPNGKLVPGDRDKILKVTAAYLLERKRKEKRNLDYVFEQVNLTAISFWATGSSRLSADKFNNLVYTGKESSERRTLFDFYTRTNNYTKMKPDEEWLISCGWDIKEATNDDNKLHEYLKEHPGAIFFSDPGGNKALELNKLYSR